MQTYSSVERELGSWTNKSVTTGKNANKQKNNFAVVLNNLKMTRQKQN
jgi:hypothetical protein